MRDTIPTSWLCAFFVVEIAIIALARLLTSSGRRALAALLALVNAAAVWLVGAVALMGYEDLFDESRPGQIWSLQSMTLNESVAFNAWRAIPLLSLACAAVLVCKLAWTSRTRLRA